METKKVDLLNLSHFEKEEMLKQAKTLLQQQKEEAKICRTLERYSQESEGYSFFPHAPRYTMEEQAALLLELEHSFKNKLLQKKAIAH